MDQVTKYAPFGTDNTPKVEYKIVGGKRVEVEIKPNENHKRLNVNTPTYGPHGTPPMQTQPFYREYEYSDLLKGYSTAKQHENARKVTSYTSPFGDRTQSFRHGPPVLNRHTVLPPIGATKTAGNNLVSSPAIANEVKNNQETTDSSLEYMVRRKMRNHPTHKLSLKDMYIELSAFDRDLTGLVNENQLSLVVLRNDLPLKLSTLKLLYHKFSDDRDPRMINYEKFLQFLSTCLSPPTDDEVPPMKKSSSTLRTKNSTDDNAESVKAGITNLLMTCAVDNKLVTMIKEQLSSSDDWNLAQLYTTLNHSDRLRNNQLSADVIRKACVTERVPLTSSILTNMLQQAEIDHGNVDWRLFLAPLACAYIQQFPNKDLIDLNFEPPKTNPTSSEPKLPQSQNNTEISKNPTRSSTKVSLKDRLSAGWDEREPRGSNQPFSNVTSGSVGVEKVSSPVHDETWIRNFNRLAHALKSYHPYKTDQLPRMEVQRMLKNYNLIYNLGFSTPRLENAVKRSVIDSTQGESESTDSVSIDNLLGVLLDSGFNP